MEAVVFPSQRLGLSVIVETDDGLTAPSSSECLKFDDGFLTAPSSNEYLSPSSPERTDERRRKQWKPRRSPQRVSGEGVVPQNAGIVFRLGVGLADIDSAVVCGQILCREYARSSRGALSPRQRIARRAQQRRQREARESSISSTVGIGSPFTFIDMFEDSGPRRSGRERKRVELDNIDFEPPKARSRRILQTVDSDDSSESPDSGGNERPYRKECASCNTRKTPMWRDAPDGVPYCNACGIRYKKYRIRCQHCHYIPRKEEKFMTSCSKCGRHINMNAPR